VILKPGARLLCELKRENGECCDQNPKCMKVKRALVFARVKFVLHRTNAVRPLACSQSWKNTEILKISERVHASSLPTIKLHESQPIR
jgi:hypothetical protein